MDYFNAFWTGGLICALVQILLDRTKLMPGRIMVLLVCTGSVLSAVGIYQPFAEFAGAGSPSPNSTSAMSAEQGKKNGGYQMGQIGHNQTRNDALNGVPSGGNAGIGSDSMKQMEKDLSSTRTGMSMDSTNNIAGNKPIEAGGHMFDRVSGSDTSSKNNEPKKPGSKDIFGDNAGRKN